VSSSATPSTPSADITTDRLILRLWTADQVGAVLDGRRSAQWAEDFPSEGDQVIAGFIAKDLGNLNGNGQRQIVERETGLVVGAIGLFWPPTDGAVEIGYGVVGSRNGRSYATEATKALVTFALNEPGVKTVFANVELSNPASVRVLEKAGLERWSSDGVEARFRATK
jgi:RimJ/RimL family protein N-acetyltransferase